MLQARAMAHLAMTSSVPRDPRDPAVARTGTKTPLAESSRPRRGPLSVVVLLVLSLCVVSRAQQVVPEGSDYHNGSTVPSLAAPQGLELLRRLEKAVAVSDPDEAAFVVSALRARRADELVRFGPRTHVALLDRAMRVVMEKGSESVRARIELESSEVLREAISFRDLDVLLDLAGRGTALSTSRDAALVAARLLFEQGRFWEAASLAGRARGLPGAEAIEAAARSRVAAEPDRRHPGPWSMRFSFQRGSDRPDVGLPLAADGRPDEALLHDSRGLYGLDLKASQLSLKTTFDSFLFGPRLLGPMQYLRAHPAPRSIHHARAGRRVVFPYNVPADRVDPMFRSARALREARLVAVDLGEGARDDRASLAWQVRVPTPGVSAALGPVSVFGGRVFAQLFRTDIDTEISLVCFDLESGDLLFETPLGRGSFIPRFGSRQAELDVDELDKRALEGIVAERDGLVYACTGFGLMSVVDGLTGRLRFTFAYDRLFSLDRNVYDPAFLFDTGGWDHEPVRIAHDRVVIAPSDSRFLYWLALEPGPGGYLIREDPMERLDRVDIVGLLPGTGSEAPDVLATRFRDNLSSLVRIRAGGQVLESSPPIPAGERQLGRPVQIGTRVVLPTERGIRVFDLRALERPGELLAAPAGLPPVKAVHAVEAGLLGFCPTPEPRRMEDALLYVVYWEGLP